MVKDGDNVQATVYEGGDESRDAYIESVAGGWLNIACCNHCLALGSKAGSEVSLASSHFINMWGPQLYCSCTEKLFLIPCLYVFAV